MTTSTIENKTPALSAEIKLFGGLLLAWLLGFDWFLLDRYGLVRPLPTGVPTVLLECLLEASIIAGFLLRPAGRGKAERYFFWFACFLLPSDVCYLILHYWLRLNEENWTTFWLTTAPYTIAYVLGCIGFYKHMRPRLANMRWLPFVWLPLLLIVPAIFGILLPLLAAHQQAAGWSFDLCEIAFNSVFAVVFFFCSTVTLLMSLEPMFPILGLAGIISQLGNWGGVSAYLLHQNTFTFGEYEYLWLCGIIAFWYALFVVRPQAPEAGPQDTVSGETPSGGMEQRRSLVIQERMTVIALVSASLICAVLLSSRDVWSYRIVFFGIAVGAFIALLIGELLSSQIIHYATQFGRVVNVTAKNEASQEQREIPVELWRVYQIAFHDEVIQHRMDAAVRRRLAELASQVAHDIRSPLLALDSILGETSKLPEEKRLVVRGAVGRIRDIANILLEKHQDTTAVAAGTAVPGPASACLLSSLIEPIISEKRVKFRSRIGVEIDAPREDLGYGLFAPVAPVEFKRAVSNLIDNAVEAIPEGRQGRVLVSVAGQGESVHVRVEDNGRGIAPELIGKLGAKGESHGKPGGSGLGLHHAKVCAEAWGGQLTIDSEVGRGTMVAMSLPQAPAPAWFVSELVLDPERVIVILDDDSSIHQVWDGRLAEAGAGHHDVQVLHFSTPGELRSWAYRDPGRARTALYLLDYELLGFTETGLSLAAELQIGKRAVLVTSRYEEPGVLDGCRKLGARMIPKSLAGLVPIRITTGARESWDAVLIDDDAIVRQIWKIAADEAGKRLLAFASPAEFLQGCDRIDPRATIYIDERLKDGVKGHEAAVEIYAKGFTEIILATGDKVDQARLTCIKSIAGKEPPWAKEPVLA